MTQNIKKLAGEVDRCLKKVSEGAETFEDIWKKVQNPGNLNQKEKYELELKKEIKKLQRLREQIKTWIASNEIKDKSALLENRKLIEIQMERFRLVEKESKMKAYSKEGLGQAKKIDPETKEYELCREWLNDTISNLNIQIDQMESETESLFAGTKKKKLDKDKVERVDELNERIERHRHHIKQIELILRSLDNESLDVEAVNKVKDDVDYYIGNCHEPDFIEFDGLYDDLDLETIVDSEPPVKNPDDKSEYDGLLSSPCSSLTSTSSFTIPNSPISKTNLTHKNNIKTPVSSTTPLVNGFGSSSPPPGSSIVTTSTTSSAKKALFTDTTAVSSVLQSPLLDNGTIKVSAIASSHFDLESKEINKQTDISPTSSNLISLSMPPSFAPSLPIVTTTNSILPDLTKPPSPNKLLTSLEQNAVESVRNHIESLKYPGFNSLNPLNRVPNGPSLPETNLPRTDSATSLTNSFSSSSSPFMSLSSLSGLTTSTSTSILNFNTSSHSNTNLYNNTNIHTNSGIHSNSSVYNSVPGQGAPVTASNLNEQLHIQTDYNFKTSNLFGLQNTSSSSKTPATNTHDVKLHPVQGVAPLGPVVLTPERMYQLKMLESSFNHLPQRQDCEKVRTYLPRRAIPVASHHYHQPLANIDSLEFFQRLSIEILFFIFYYQEGTKAQYLAAKALKKQSWRFHTKYMMWFQRHEEPKRITDEYEEGTYIFFDYEKWTQRKRDGFTFEYRFLEDKDLP